MFQKFKQRKWQILGGAGFLCFFPILSGLSATTLILMYIGLAFFSSVVYMLYWSAQTGQLKNFEAQARMIFDTEEPEGLVLEDSFAQKPKAPKPAPFRP